MASTASSPEANLVAMSISSLARVGVLRPSLLTRSWQVVPARNAPMTSESVTLGRSVRCFENHRLLAAASEIPGVPRAHVRALEVAGEGLDQVVQLEICPGGKCSSQARAVSERNKGKVADDEVVIVRSTQVAGQLVVREPQFRPRLP
jgi:hypothetical protein